MISFIYSWDYNLAYPFQNYPPSSLTGTTYYNHWGNPVIVTSAGLLTLSFDDIVTKRVPFTSAVGASSYCFFGNVCPFTTPLTRRLIFQPVVTTSRLWPSIVSNGSGDPIIRGETYGSATNGNFGNLSGQTLLKRTLTYAFFVDQENGLVAFKITDGVTTLDSGFVQAFPTTQHMLRNSFILDNGTGGSGAHDRVLLTGIIGFYEMTGIELSAAYESELSYVENFAFVIEPENSVASIGDDFSFVAAATPSNCVDQNIQYLWYREGQLLDVSGSVYRINPVSEIDFASYVVVLTDGVTQVSSSPFILSPLHFSVSVDKLHSPSPGYFLIRDISTYYDDYLLTLNIRDDNTSGAYYNNNFYLSGGNYIEIPLDGIYGTTYSFYMSATYSTVEYG